MIEPVSSDCLRKRNSPAAAPKVEDAPRKRVAVRLSRGHLRFVEISPRITEPRAPRGGSGR
ncbi:MAG TPA: hypothetical protein VJ921_13680 [Vicinamibacteria bacterium]|nr:hypothetical protein [Vicinamibacteria bacterium]